MKKHHIICIVILLFASVILSTSIVGAQENTTENVTESTIVSESESTTETQTENEEQVFRVGPTVRLRPLNSEIDQSADGIVELFMNNPSLNDVSLEVDMTVSVPSGIYVYGEEGGMSGGAGTVTGHFSVPPGSSRTITMHVKGEETGTFPVHFSGMYWPGDDKDKWNPISLDSSFKVNEPSKDIEDIDEASGGSGSMPELPYSYILVGGIVIIGLVLIIRRPPKTEVTIEE